MQLHGDLHARLDFVFSENGVHAFRGGECLHCKSIVEHLGEARWAKFEATLERLLRDARDEASALLRRAVGADGAAADVGGRGTFLERRQCTVNICPIGRTPTLSKAERGAFDAADREAGLRKRLVAALNDEFGPATEFALTFSIGGQIGIDCCPVGWDKTFCLRFVPEGEFPTVHFFGDKTEPGGGDHEIFVHPRTVGHAVASRRHGGTGGVDFWASYSVKMLRNYATPEATVQLYGSCGRPSWKTPKRYFIADRLLHKVHRDFPDVGRPVVALDP